MEYNFNNFIKLKKDKKDLTKVLSDILRWSAHLPSEADKEIKEAINTIEKTKE